MRLFSWNVNGIRAVAGKGFLEWLQTESPDVLALQETKAQPNQLDETLLHPEGYHSLFVSAEKKGYSGVAMYSKTEPVSVENLGIDEFDSEGRVLIAHFPDFSLINAYFPNSQAEGARLEYKLNFCHAILEKCNRFIKEGRNLVLCGDYNIAHTEIDLKNPKSNTKNPGFLPEEREWMSEFLSAGYADVFREQHPDEPDHYTWWSYRFQARAKNVGWRIDYHCINEGFRDALSEARIHADVMGSDHCPVSLKLNI